MIGDLGRYSQVSMTDGISQGKVKGGGVASDMTGMMMGMQFAKEMTEQMGQTQKGSSNQGTPSAPSGEKPNFCPNCGTKTGDGNFCSNCGQKL